MLTVKDDLRHQLNILLGEGKSVEACLILEDMFLRGEIYRQSDKWSCCPTVSTRTLDRIAGIEDVIHCALLVLFVEGRFGFNICDRGKGLEIVWQLRPEAEESVQ
jgi:hypothetical protein